VTFFTVPCESQLCFDPSQGIDGNSLIWIKAVFGRAVQKQDVKERPAESMFGPGEDEGTQYVGLL
jgi:hypothetical protein